MSDITWTITGKIIVEEEAISGVSKSRPLANAEVEISASNFGSFGSWGKVRTDSDGSFSMRKEKDHSKRKFKITVRFADDELEVNSGLLASAGDFLSPSIKIFEHANEVEGPTINIGTKTFAAGGGSELGDLENRRRAITWYVGKKLISTLRSKDSYFNFKDKIKVVYPANNVGGACYANGLTRSAYIHSTGSSDQWNVQTVLHEVMHLWNYDHNHGTTNWLTAVTCPPDLDTHSQSERINVAFHEGFAEFASWQLMWEMWGNESGATRDDSAMRLPYTRYALTHDYRLDNVDEVEQSDNGVHRALNLLVMTDLYDHKFGTNDKRLDSDPNPKLVRTEEHDCPHRTNYATIWDVLKVFQANSGAGYSQEWEVGRRDYGVRRFIERAGDILPNLDEITTDLMLGLIDPNSEEQPVHEGSKHKHAAR